MQTLLGNIARQPLEPKFRRVRRSNARIASLVGREEEGILRAVGFCDDAAVAGEEASLVFCRDAATAGLAEVLAAIEVVCAVLQDQATSKAGEPSLRCHDVAVARALECALLDHFAARSAEQAEAEKRRRRSAEAEAVRSPQRWREALSALGGEWLCDGALLHDGGVFELWLEQDAQNRSLAYDLLQLQSAAVRWYGLGAQRHCEEWWLRLFAVAEPLDTAPQQLARANTPLLFPDHFGEELCLLRETLFEFPERPGAMPALFRRAEAEAEEEAKKKICASATAVKSCTEEDSSHAQTADANEEGGKEGATDCALTKVLSVAEVKRATRTILLSLE